MIDFLKMLRIRRELILELVLRELRDRHAGQSLGRIWAYGHPLLLMIIYSFLFAYVFPTRFGSGMGLQDFSLNVLAGILPWLAFQDLLARSPSVLIGHANLVKQIVFPIEVLPVKTAMASVLPFVLGLLFTIGYAGLQGRLAWIVLALPGVIICQLAAMTGAALLLSAVGVFFRDIRELVQVFCTVNLFAQPILYNPFSTPEFLQTIFLFNPFSYLIWCWQDALYHGAPLHPVAWVVLPLASLGLLLLGWIAFKRMSHAFGDAL
jgi:lipopolysaccharide transport system permease protein